MGEGLEVGRIAILFAAVSLAAVSDVRHRIIPNRITMLAALGLVALATLDGWPALAASLEGAALLGMGVLGLFLVARGGLGMGDVKLAAVIGLGLGPEAGGLAIVLAFLLGACHGLAMLVAGRAGLRDAIPFGPSLAVGAIVMACLASPLTRWLPG